MAITNKTFGKMVAGNYVGASATITEETSTDATAIAAYVSETISGTHGETYPTYGIGMYGKISATDYSGTGTYMAGAVGMYNVSGTNASDYPSAGVIGWIADSTTTADGAFIALLDGNSGAKCCKLWIC